MGSVLRVAVPLIAVALLALAANPSAAQQPAPQLQITDVDATAYPQLRAVVTALDATGVPVGGLTAASFEASEGANALAVEDVRNEQLSLAVALVIDTSGSMEGQPLAAAKDAARQFVQNLRPGDSAALFAFSNEVRPVVPFTGDVASIVAGIDGLQAVGDTALFEAAQVSLFATNAAQLPRRAVVLLSDGQNTLGDPAVTAQSSTDVARNTGIPVYTIGFGAAPDTSYLQQLSSASGGQYRAATAGTVTAVYGDITRLLESQYTLTMRAPGPATVSGTSILRLVVNIAGTPVSAERPFTLPALPVQPTVVPPASTVAVEDGGGSSRVPLLAVGGAAGGVLLAVIGIAALALVQRARTRRQQLAVVEPNLRQAQAQGLPEAMAGQSLDLEDGFGRLTALDGSSAGETWDFSATPVRIGSGAECEVRLASSPEVAPHHAAIWMRDGKIMLRHMGGPRRPTFVGGRPVDWVILESGDEVVVAGNRWRAETR